MRALEAMLPGSCWAAANTQGGRGCTTRRATSASHARLPESASSSLRLRMNCWCVPASSSARRGCMTAASTTSSSSSSRGGQRWHAGGLRAHAAHRLPRACSACCSSHGAGSVSGCWGARDSAASVPMPRQAAALTHAGWAARLPPGGRVHAATRTARCCSCSCRPPLSASRPAAVRPGVATGCRPHTCSCSSATCASSWHSTSPVVGGATPAGRCSVGRGTLALLTLLSASTGGASPGLAPRGAWPGVWQTGQPVWRRALAASSYRCRPSLTSRLASATTHSACVTSLSHSSSGVTRSSRSVRLIRQQAAEP